MNAIDLLEQQHREAQDLLQKIQQGGAGRARTFGELADALAIHGEIEEKIFYPAVKAKPTEEVLEHSLEEHQEMKQILTDMLDLKPNDKEFADKCKELEQVVLDHVEDERTQLFPKVQKLMDAQELQRLGNDMQQMTADLKAAPMKPREVVPLEAREGPPSLE